MRKLWLIIKREYFVHIKSKAFIVTTIIVPLVGFVLFAVTDSVASLRPIHSIRLAVLDKSGFLAPLVAQGLTDKLPGGSPEFLVETIHIGRGLSFDAAQDHLRARINAGSLDAFLLIPSDVDQPVELHARNPDSLAIRSTLTAAVDKALIAERLSARGIYLDDVKDILRSAQLKLIKVSPGGEAVDRGQSVSVVIALVMLLYLSLVMYGIMTMRSVLEEKTTRTMEVLIASVRPFQLLSGKIIGVAATAFTQFLIWAAALAAVFSYSLLAGAGVSDSAFSNARLPPSLLVFAGIYLIGGYLLYSSIYAAIGAACSNEQDAQLLQWPATLPLVFSVAVFGIILADPASNRSVVLSEVPFLTPTLMTLRIAVQNPPVWQITLSMAFLFLSIVVVVYCSSRIYRVGVLMYGKRPTLPELLRWLRYS